MTLHIEDLHQIARIEKDINEGFRHRIHVCVAAGCLSCGSATVKEALEREVTRRGLANWCKVKGVGCLGLCTAGPLIALDPGGTYYQGVTVADVPEILDSLEASPVSRLVCPHDAAFFTRQHRLVLENCGVIDPERIEEYIAAGGYEGLHLAVTRMTPQEVIDQVTESGLRGRGGAGFPTGLKWRTVSKTVDPVKFIICNADEGDPGASWIVASSKAIPTG